MSQLYPQKAYNRSVDHEMTDEQDDALVSRGGYRILSRDICLRCKRWFGETDKYESFSKNKDDFPSWRCRNKVITDRRKDWIVLDQNDNTPDDCEYRVEHLMDTQNDQ